MAGELKQCLMRPTAVKVRMIDGKTTKALTTSKLQIYTNIHLCFDNFFSAISFPT